jgi:hypothetical protein
MSERLKIEATYESLVEDQVLHEIIGRCFSFVCFKHSSKVLARGKSR